MNIKTVEESRLANKAFVCVGPVLWKRHTHTHTHT